MTADYLENSNMDSSETFVLYKRDINAHKGTALTPPDIRQLHEAEDYAVLIEALLPMVLSLAGKMKPLDGRVDYMDIVQAGNLGLIQSVQSWNPDGGVALTTWAWRYIRREIMREITRTPMTATLDEAGYAPKDISMLAEDVDVNPEDGKATQRESAKDALRDMQSLEPSEALIEEERFTSLLDAIDMLEAHSDRQAEAVRLVYLRGLTQVQVADLMGVSQKNVSKLLQRGIKFLADWQ